MADSDNTLKLLIEMGVVGHDDVKAAHELVTETATAADAAGEAEEQAAGKTRKYTAENAALQKSLESLNGVIPGLGSTLSLLSAAYDEEAAAAEAGVVANESFITSMGPLAIVMLGIQAASEYWDVYKEHAKAAEEAQTAALKKTVDSLHQALAAQQAFNEAVNGGNEDTSEKHDQEAAKEIELLRAQVQGNKEVLAVQEQQALAAAKAPAEKAEVQKRFAGLNQAQSDLQTESEIGIKRNEMQDIGTEIATRTEQGKQIKEQIVSIGTDGDPDARKKLVQEWNEQTDAIKRLTQQYNRLKADTDSDSAAQDIRRQTEKKVEAQRIQGDGTVEAGVAAIAASEHGQASQKQLQATNSLQHSFNVIAGNVDALLDAIKYGHDHALTQAQEVAYIKNKLQTLAQQSAATAAMGHK